MVLNGQRINEIILGISSYKYTMDDWYDSIDRSDIMIKLSKRKLRENTLENEVESLKYENNNLKAKILLLQDKIIAYEERDAKRKEELLEYKNKEIKRLKEKNKRSEK